MDEFRESHSDGIDQPLAHEAGVNHTINSAGTQLKAQNLRAANFLVHSMIGDLQEKVSADRVKVKDNALEFEEL